MNLKYFGSAAGLAVGGLAVLLALAAGAGEAWGMGHSEKDVLYKLKPIGFSEDGGVFAYVFTGMEETGENGRLFAQMYFLDVEKNRYLKPKKVIARQDFSNEYTENDLKDVEEGLVEKVVQQTEEAFKKYGIRKGEFLGEAVKITRGRSGRRCR